MFGEKKVKYPPIDIRFKRVKTLFGGYKQVRATIDEQRRMAATIKRKNPKLTIISDLSDTNWIDELEELDAIFDDNSHDYP